MRFEGLDEDKEHGLVIPDSGAARPHRAQADRNNRRQGLFVPERAPYRGRTRRHRSCLPIELAAMSTRLSPIFASTTERPSGSARTRNLPHVASWTGHTTESPFARASRSQASGSSTAKRTAAPPTPEPAGKSLVR